MEEDLGVPVPDQRALPPKRKASAPSAAEEAAPKRQHGKESRKRRKLEAAEAKTIASETGIPTEYQTDLDAAVVEDLVRACRADPRFARSYTGPLLCETPPPKTWCNTARINNGKAKHERPTLLGARCIYGAYLSTSRFLQCAQVQGEDDVEIGPMRLFGLDCEMVECENDTKTLARVSLVERVKGKAKPVVLLDEYVKVNDVVVDYKTTVSGIEEQHLASATLTMQ
eukprot:gene11231-13273_t